MARPRKYVGMIGEMMKAFDGDISPDPDPQGPGAWAPIPEPDDPDLKATTWVSVATPIKADPPPADWHESAPAQAGDELKTSDRGPGPQPPRGSENLAAPNPPGIGQAGAFTAKSADRPPRGEEAIGIGLDLGIGKGKVVRVHGRESRQRMREIWELKRFAKRKMGPIDPYPIKGGIAALRGRGAKAKTELEKIRGAILDIQQKRVDPRTIPGGFRTRIIQFFLEMQPDTSVGAVADLLGVSRNLIRETRRKLIRDAVWEITDLDIKEIASGLNMTKRTLQEMATANKDYSAAWRMETDWIDKMAELGFIAKVPKRVEGTNFNIDLNREMEEFIKRYGIPSPGELVKILRGMGGMRLGGGGGGDGGGKTAIRLSEGRGIEGEEGEAVREAEVEEEAGGTGEAE